MVPPTSVARIPEGSTRELKRQRFGATLSSCCSTSAISLPSLDSWYDSRNGRGSAKTLPVTSNAQQVAISGIV
jgi:hypothetical protein